MRTRLRPDFDALTILVVALVPAVATGIFHPRHPDWSRRALVALSENEATKGNLAPLWVDVRPYAEFQVAHIPGAVLFDLSARWDDGLGAIVKRWKPTQRIIVYCEDAHCTSSSDVARRLQKDLGTSDIVILRGGWAAWKRENP